MLHGLGFMLKLNLIGRMLPSLRFRVEIESDMADASSEMMEELLKDVREGTEQFLRQETKRRVEQFLGQRRSELPSPPQDERPPKEKIESMLRDLLSKNSDNVGWLDVLHSERYKKEVNEILSLVERMRRDGESCDVVSSNDVTLRELGKEISSLANSQSLLRKCDEENSKPWLTSTCLPIASDSYTRKIRLEWPCYHLVNEVERLLSPGLRIGKCSSAASSNDVMEKEAHNVTSLLSRDGNSTLVSQTGDVIPIDTLVKKYVLVCCIAVPVVGSLASYDFQSLLNLCEELSSRCDVKIVMVARMNILADTTTVFNHSFSGFPESCLAVPYEDWERRERIWKLLNCRILKFNCFVYGTDGSFLKSYYVEYDEIPLGADAFPFTEKMIVKARQKQKELVGKDLVTFLKPCENSPDVVVEEFDGKQRRRILDVIKNKYVGLYVCSEGSLIPLLHDLYKKCKEKKELEIVVLYAPRICPRMFKEKIEVLLRDQNTLGWWCLPFNNSVSLRCDPGFSRFEDALIIVGPDGKISNKIDPYQISQQGIPVVYPFSRKDRRAVIEMQMGQEIGEVRLKLLLEPLSGCNCKNFFRGDDLSDTISVDSLLRSKKIIIFMDNALECRAGGIRYGIFRRLVDHYKKKGKEEFEVVFIEYPQFQIGAESAHRFSKMPWYIQSPLNGGYTSLAEGLKDLFDVPSLVVFGEDGHICSVRLLENLRKNFGIEKLFSGDALKQDIHQLFCFLKKQVGEDFDSVEMF